VGTGRTYYSEGEYDLTALRTSGRKLLELGRSCVHPDYRGGTAMFHLWNALADYVLDRGIEILFGVASFHGTDIAALTPSLAYLHHHHLAPEGLRVRARLPQFQRMDLLPADRLDRKAAMAATPALIKAYLRLGGFVGEGAWIDHAFNTTDVCLVMDTARMSERHRAYYTRGKITA
jgi:putative hemolysin